MEIIDSERHDTFWSSAWDAAYDAMGAMLLRPYVNSLWTQKEYDLLLAPLKAVGWQAPA